MFIYKLKIIKNTLKSKNIITNIEYKPSKIRLLEIKKV